MGFQMAGLKPVRDAVSPQRCISSEELLSLLERVLASPYFASAGRKKRFLSVVVDYHLNGRSDELSESVLVCELFGEEVRRKPADPSRVRVCAHEVRKRLKSYFENEGASESLLIEIPVGAYRPVFLERPRETPVEEAAPDAVAPVGARRRSWIWLALALLAAAGSGWYLRSVQQAIVSSPPSFWAPFLSGPGSVMVVVSNPPLFQFLYSSDPVGSKRELLRLSPDQVASLEKTLEPDAHREPYLVLSAQEYTGMGEAQGLMHLTRFFDRYRQDVIVKQSRTAGTEDAKSHNMVIVGGPLSNQWSRTADSLEFDLSQNYVLNRKPLPGEEKEYRVSVDPLSGKPATDWSVVSLIPGIAPGRVVMMLAGIRSQGCQAAAEFVTNRQSSLLLQQRVRASGSAYFQALLRVEVKDWVPAKITLEAFHPLKIK
ncbi:MAG: hypothetical protein HY821_21825 [Acidobacteria bacterium]|nr:hypothetical protein [Acidobacteriota bacterium]